MDQQANQRGDRSLNSTTKRLKRLDRLRSWKRAPDLEADLVKLGVAERIVSRYVAGDAAHALVAKAIDTALPLSRVRRAAHRAHVSMKRGGLQVPLSDMPEDVLSSWETRVPDDSELIATVAAVLGWDVSTSDRVLAEIGVISQAPEDIALGKDILDALFRLARRHGSGDVRGWSGEHFRKTVRRGLTPDDFAGWVVGQRLARWSASRGHQLMIQPDAS